MRAPKAVIRQAAFEFFDGLDLGSANTGRPRTRAFSFQRSLLLHELALFSMESSATEGGAQDIAPQRRQAS